MSDKEYESEEHETVSNIFALIEEHSTLRKALEKACEYLAIKSASCPYIEDEWSSELNGANSCNARDKEAKDCWLQYFMESKHEQ